MMDRGPDTGRLPNCTQCNAPFYPNSFHYAMAQLATRSLELRPLPETRTVSRIRLEVRPSVQEELYYQPAALERRALRGENPGAAEAFQPGLEAGNENRHNQQDLTSSPTHYGDVDEQYPGNDVESEDDYGQAQDDHQLPADARSEGTGYESDYEDIEDIRQHPVRAAEVHNMQYGNGRRLGTDEDASTTDHFDELPTIPNSNGSGEGDAAVKDEDDDSRVTFRRHWRYGRGRTINDAPEPSPDTVDDGVDENANSTAPQVTQNAPDTVGANVSVPLYSFAHGRGHRLGEAPPSDPAPTASATNTSSLSTQNTANESTRSSQPTQQQPPAPLYSFQHGLGSRLGTCEIDAESTPYLYQPGRGRGSGLQNQLGTMGRFRHGHGWGRTLGE